jgi:hypothetical protein
MAKTISVLLAKEEVCALEHKDGAEDLPRTPFGRSSEKSTSKHFGEYGQSSVLGSAF